MPHSKTASTTDARYSKSGGIKRDATSENMLREEYEERAAILEYDAHYTRERAETLAWAMVYERKRA
tara:strand:- start:582 stop:782 length:201 start_codon:yes stop_codon:yes gene_type:complete